MNQTPVVKSGTIIRDSKPVIKVLRIMNDGVMVEFGVTKQTVKLSFWEVEKFVS